MDFSHITPIPRKRESATWGDYGRAAGIGLKPIADLIPTFTQYAQQSGGDPDTLAAIFKDWTDELAQGAFENMTEAGQEALSARWLPDEDNPDVWDGSVNVGSALALQTMASIPSLAAIVGATLYGGPAGGSAAVGGIYGTQAYDEILEALKDAPPEEFANNELYNELLEEGKSHEEARQRVIAEAAGLKPVFAGLAAAGAARAIGIPGQLGRGRTLPRVRSAARVGAGESLAEMAQEGVTAATSQAGVYAAIGQEMDGYEIAQRMAAGGVLGGVLGAGTGATFPQRGAPVVTDTRSRNGLPEQTDEAARERMAPDMPGLEASLEISRATQGRVTPDQAVAVSTAAAAPAEAPTQRAPRPPSQVDPAQQAALTSTAFDDASEPAVFGQQAQQPVAQPPAEEPVTPTPPMTQPEAGRPAVSTEGVTGTVPTIDPVIAAPQGTAQPQARQAQPFTRPRPPVNEPVDLARPEFIALQPTTEEMGAPVQGEQAAPAPADPNQLPRAPRILKDLQAKREALERGADEFAARSDERLAAQKKEKDKARKQAERGAAREERDQQARSVVMREDLGPLDQEWGYAIGPARDVMPVTEARLSAMLDAAEEAGVELPDSARHTSSGSVAMLSEARKHRNRLRKAIKGRRGLSPKHRSDLAGFITRHREVLAGYDIDEVRRGRTIEENARGTGARAGEGVAPAEGVDTAQVGTVVLSPVQSWIRDEAQAAPSDESEAGGSIQALVLAKQQDEAVKAQLDARRGEPIPEKTPPQKNVWLERKGTPPSRKQALERAREAARKRDEERKTAARQSRKQTNEANQVLVENTVADQEATTLLLEEAPVPTASTTPAQTVTPVSDTASARAARATANPLAHGARETTINARLIALASKLSGAQTAMAQIARLLHPRLAKILKDTPVYIVPRQGMMEMLADQANPERIPAFYDTVNKQIMIRDDVMSSDPDRAAHVVLHEMMHAAVHDLVESSPRIKAQYQRLFDEAKRYYDVFTAVPGQETPYGLTNLHEFIAESMTNEQFMQYLATIEASPDTLQQLGLDARPRSLWDALVDFLGDLFGIEGVERSVLAAFIRTTEDVIALRERTPIQRPTRTQGQRDVLPMTEALDRRGRPILQRWHRQLADWGLKWTTTGGLAQLIETNFPEGNAFREAGVRAARALLSMGNKRSKYSQEGRQILHRLADLHKESPEAYRQLNDVIRELVRNDTAVSSVVGANESDLLAINRHVSKKSRQDVVKRERMVAIQRQFEKLPAKVRELHLDMQQYFKGHQEQAVRDLINAALLTVPEGRLSDAQRKDIAERAFNRRLNDSDKELIGDILFRDLVRNARYHKPTGTYFPGMRFGRYRVFAKARIGDLMGGTLNRDGRQELVEFIGPTDKGAWAKAEKFMRSPTGDDLYDNGRVERRYFDKKTGERLDPIDARTMEESDVEVRVLVPIQREFLSAFDTLADAKQFIEDSRSDFENMSAEPLDAQSHNIANELDGTQLGALLKEVQNSRLDAAVKDEAETAIYQASLKLMSGLRHQQRAIRTRKVRGASSDMMRIFYSYNEAVAGFRARREVYKEADASINEMREYDSARPYDAERPMRQRYMREVAARFEGVRNYSDPNQFVADLLTVSFNNYLASPAYSVINATQVAMVAYPEMAGQFGGARAAAEITKAYNTIGGLSTVGRGLGNTLAAVKQWERLAIKTDNPINAIRGMLAKQADAKLLMRAWDRVQEVSLIELEAGFEVQSDQFAGRGAWGRALGKTTRIFRQLPQAVEAMNRATTLVAAARLHYAKHGDIEAAAEYARQTVEKSQGDYSAENAPELFRRNNIWRMATQFQKFPQLMMQLQVFMFRQMIKGATKEERRIAVRQFSYLAGMQIAVGGAIGFPMLELVKIPVMLGALAGMNDGWEPWERWLEEIATEVTSSEKFGEAFSRGLITRPLGVDVSTRINLGNLVIGFGTDDYSRDNVHAYIATRVLGAPGTYVTGLFDASQDAAKGDWLRAFEKAVPIKAISDSMKAMRDEDINIPERVLLSTGLQPASRARRFQEFRQSRTEQRQRASQKDALERRWRRATTATQRRLLRREIEAYNREAPFRERTYPWNWSN